jgi:transcriptional regulator with XRE-family HTH domain
MSPVDQLRQDLKTQFPDAEIETRKSDDPSGFQFLNFLRGGFEVGVEWKKEHGFGTSSFRDDSSSIEGFFDSPSEWYETEQAAFHRVASLVFDQRSTRPPQARISEIRHERGLSQEELSEQLSVKQATYSKLERREDVKVSSLRRVIEARGGASHSSGFQGYRRCSRNHVSVISGCSVRQTHAAIDESSRFSQPLPVLQTGSRCESLGDSNQRVMVIFCCV